MSIIIIFIIFSNISFATEANDPGGGSGTEEPAEEDSNNSTNASSSKNMIIGKLQKVGDEAGYPQAHDYTIIDTIAIIIKSILSLLGIIFLILTIISGFQWMTAGGNEDTINKAKAKLKNSIIGLAIVLLSFTISTFVFNVLNQRP